MANQSDIKKEFIAARDKIFKNQHLQKDAFKFCVAYSILVEEYIFKVLCEQEVNFVIASAGSFSRRELSPFSDIDIMFITDSVENSDKSIQECVRILWDCGIEVSNTVRDYDDIEKYLSKDLHAFTQFFETRYLLGPSQIYENWNEKLFSSLAESNESVLIFEYFEDIEARHNKYGNSSKMLEPNVKFSAGGLRDLQAVEWMYSLKNKVILSTQKEITHTESFIELLKEQNFTTPRECKSVLESYRFILGVRNILHLISRQRNDRLEFSSQTKIARILDYKGASSVQDFMKKYFEASNTIGRFSKTMRRRMEEEITKPLSSFLEVELDEDFVLKGSTLSLKKRRLLSMSDILRVFYYRGLHNARFDENLRSLVIESLEYIEDNHIAEPESSVFFREILRLPKNVGETLYHMNELGVIKIILPEFKELIGFYQPGVYHNYTADEHTIVAIKNTEKLSGHESQLGRLFTSLKDKEILFLAILFHDIAKPISVAGHEIIGAEVASSIMYRLGYEEAEVEQVNFLVANHLMMEQVAFRRNLNDPITLNNFTSRFSSVRDLDLLYLVTYADLSAVNPMVWTEWKSELLAELYRKSRAMLIDQISGEELLYSTIITYPQNGESGSDSAMQDHIESINDIGYTQIFSEEEISSHVEEIDKGSDVSVFYKELNAFTNVTIITLDSPLLLSRLCGVLSINDLNIHDARIFTRKDGIVIDSFAVTDFRTHKHVNPDRYAKITADMEAVIKGDLQLNQEMTRMKSKWWRIENKFFKRSGKIKIAFEDHEKYSIIDIFSPDRLGLLYQITRKMGELGLSIYFAKIGTKADDVVDSFYILDRNNKKISPGDYEFIKSELTEAIEQIL